MPTPSYIVELRTKIGHTLLMMPTVVAFVRNDQGQVLLQRRVDNGQWVLLGGAIEPDEQPADAVVREVWEETGLIVIPEQIIGVYGGPDLHCFYPNGDEIQLISTVFACWISGGALTTRNDNESLEVAYFAPDALPPTIMIHHRAYLMQAFKSNIAAYFHYETHNS